MIVILQPNITHTSDEYKTVRDYLEHLPDVTIQPAPRQGFAAFEIAADGVECRRDKRRDELAVFTVLGMRCII